jgi:hypothetical protein
MKFLIVTYIGWIDFTKGKNAKILRDDNELFLITITDICFHKFKFFFHISHWSDNFTFCLKKKLTRLKVPFFLPGILLDLNDLDVLVHSDAFDGERRQEDVLELPGVLCVSRNLQTSNENLITFY